MIIIFFVVVVVYNDLMQIHVFVKLKVNAFF